MIAAVLVVVGLVGVTLFAWCVWPPLAFLPFSIAATVAGLLVDWKAVLHGEPSTPPDRP